MNANATTGISELTAQELDQVTGGASWSQGMSDGEFAFVIGLGAAMVYGAFVGLWDWLFGSLHPRFDEYPETGVKGTEWILERSAAPREIASAWVRQMIYPFVMIYGSVAVALGRARPLPPRVELLSSGSDP